MESKGFIGALALILLLIVATFGSTIVWIIAALAAVALAVVIFALYREDRFQGPGVLVDDAREKIARMVAADSEADRIREAQIEAEKMERERG